MEKIEAVIKLAGAVLALIASAIQLARQWP
jgi:hypothetical protein